jgi:hypothetical protein
LSAVEGDPEVIIASTDFDYHKIIEVDDGKEMFLDEAQQLYFEDRETEKEKAVPVIVISYLY